MVPEPFWLSCCILETYCLLTVFQAAMYLSMHCERQVCSPLLKVLPGFGMHLAKQCSLIF